MIEQVIPWEPVPPYANVFFALGVVRFEITAPKGLERAEVVAFAPNQVDAPLYHGVDGWRITFERVLAARFRPIPGGPGSPPLRRRPIGISVRGRWRPPRGWRRQFRLIIPIPCTTT